MSGLLRDFRPYDPSELRIVAGAGAPPNPGEQRMMDDWVNDMLESMTLDDYVAARGGLDAAAEYVDDVVRRAAITPLGRVLEFGAGNCKSAAVLSRYPEVTEVVANDFSEPLLREIAPRVISHLGGALEKFTFVVGDMHEVETLRGPFDLVICYLTMHHLLLPEWFLHRLRGILAPDGRVLCLREPAIPALALPPGRVRAYVSSQREKRRAGESEHVYTVAGYRAMAEPEYRFELVRASVPVTRVWRAPFEIAYTLTPA